MAGYSIFGPAERARTMGAEPITRQAPTCGSNNDMAQYFEIARYLRGWSDLIRAWNYNHGFRAVGRDIAGGTGVINYTGAGNNITDCAIQSMYPMTSIYPLSN